MSDDLEISKLITQSMRGDLSDEQQQQIGESIEQNEESKRFAALTQQIHESVAGFRPSDDELEQSKLPEDVRQRLNESVAEAIQEKLSVSQIDDDKRLTSPTGRWHGSVQSSDAELITSMTRFRKIRKLASGGIGEVWVAKDEQLGRNVVIKRLNPDTRESALARDRFQREAEITGLLEHPNIVPLYMHGVDNRTDEPFYAMRFVGRRTLADVIEEHHDRVAAGQAGGLSLHRLLNIFLDICQAIAYAHSRGVIHRDLKPENIAIDKFGQVIVLDWGLAKIIENSELAIKLNAPNSSAESCLGQTVDGEVIGTPVFMAPEQAAGEIDQIDTRTDVYGLGGILFSILTGHAPHANVAQTSETGFKEIVKQIGAAPTPKPSQFAAVAAGLEAICVRSLSRKRHLRFDSVSDFAAAIEKWMVGQSGRKLNYEKLRMEGRELRSDLQTRVHDLERNVSFCVGLPPVQELIKADTDEDQAIWRKRMSMILQGLMEANPGYHSIVYGRFEGDSYTEIVRVEKLSGPSEGIRTTPKSRLQTREQCEFLKKVSGLLPGEVRSSLVCGDEPDSSSLAAGLQSAVPVYDRETEEVFGFVVATRNLLEMIDKQLSRRHSAGEVIVAGNDLRVLSHKSGGQLMRESRFRSLTEVADWFTPVAKHLQTNADFVDASDSQYYGARIWFEPNESGLMFLLKLS